MIRRYQIIFPFIIFFFTETYVHSQEPFRPPVEIPVFLSANFCELRTDHFHSGIDIKTRGTTGEKVVAAADGYIYLIIVSPTGFGKALYMRHPSGYSTVYAHLDSFNPEIEEYVKRHQYQNKSYSVRLYPPKERFVFKQGELIGYSGNTGSSAGPHLHFEVRKSAGEKPINPLIFNFGVEDNLKPLIEKLVIYPATKSTRINGSSNKLVVNTTGRNGIYKLPGNTTIRIKGTAGFGISCRDLMNNTSNKFGVNYIELTIDSVQWFTCDLCEFDFSETRYINAHIDYEAAVRSNIWIHKTFVLPNDRLSMYRHYMNNGLYDFSDGLTHKIKITVKDGYGNTSVLNFDVRSELVPVTENNQATENIREDYTIMPYGKSNTFKSEGIIVNIPRGALYDTLYFRYSAERSNHRFLSPVHQVHDRFTPVHKEFTLSIRPDSIPAAGPSKLLIVRIDEKKNLIPAGGTYFTGFITTSVNQFGNYAIAVDTVPPLIIPVNFTQNSDLTPLKEIRIKITDNLSGIKEYTGLIDGEWALFEYDPKRDLIFYKFDEERISKGSKHNLNLTVTDNCGNTSVLKRDFYW